ncbi:hypothetical protein [Sphingomonas sp. CFBP 8760]|uniref:hypothetical protein n=1 Tax=Sphingomonas sp. CFBP 8760 TaxID=2775282 RepID=UPI00177A9E6A|nr:hypothetical protein [Sphingomonas sp. CFBP 8760]MBD8548034.1 hypothetical protein [Sphingomonas sp. CFBP 8760]
MTDALPATPLFAGLTVNQHFAKAHQYDVALVAFEGVVVAGLAPEDVRASRAAMLHSYCVRVGAIIAGCDPTDRADLMEIAQQKIAEAADIVRMLRS